MSLEKPHNDQQDHDVTGELNYFKFKLFQIQIISISCLG